MPAMEDGCDRVRKIAKLVREEILVRSRTTNLLPLRTSHFVVDIILSIMIPGIGGETRLILIKEPVNLLGRAPNAREPDATPFSCDSVEMPPKSPFTPRKTRDVPIRPRFGWCVGCSRVSATRWTGSEAFKVHWEFDARL